MLPHFIAGIPAVLAQISSKISGTVTGSKLDQITAGLTAGTRMTNLDNIDQAISILGKAKSTMYTSGTGNFTVPAGVSILYVTLQGGGGGGGGGGLREDGNTIYISGGGGGGSGARCSAVVSVTPSQVISYTVGGAGTGSPATLMNVNNSFVPPNGTAGGTTYFSILKAEGGKGGDSGSSGVQGFGGDGGGLGLSGTLGGAAGGSALSPSRLNSLWIGGGGGGDGGGGGGGSGGIVPTAASSVLQYAGGTTTASSQSGGGGAASGYGAGGNGGTSSNSYTGKTPATDAYGAGGGGSMGMSGTIWVTYSNAAGNGIGGFVYLRWIS